MAYVKAPITEAVIEFVFDQSITQSVIESAARRVESDYPQKDVEETAQFHIDPKIKSGQVPAKWSWNGLKLNSTDRTNILLFRKDRFACIRLAPYNGWEQFQARAVHGWDEWKKSAGTVGIKRVGLRYINRIDVPKQNNPLIRIEEYLNVLPKGPEILDQPMTGYAIQMTRSLGADDCGLSLTSSSVTSPLVGYASFALDIDVFRDKDIPRREDDLWALVQRMREHKNRIFEACVNDKARALFQ